MNTSTISHALNSRLELATPHPLHNNCVYACSSTQLHVSQYPAASRSMAQGVIVSLHITQFTPSGLEQGISDFFTLYDSTRKIRNKLLTNTELFIALKNQNLSFPTQKYFLLKNIFYSKIFPTQKYFLLKNIFYSTIFPTQK